MKQKKNGIEEEKYKNGYEFIDKMELQSPAISASQLPFPVKINMNERKQNHEEE